MEIRNIEEFIHFFQRVHSRTSRLIDTIPPEKINWKPGSNSFSFADIIRHISAIERFMFAENIQFNPSSYPGHEKNLASGYQKILDYYHTTHEETVAILQDLNPENLEKKCQTPAGVEITVWKWLRSMIEHHIHHRGQIYAYLNLLGVPSPPLYGLTSEEVRERSV